MNENKFWICVWAVLGLTAVLLATVIFIGAGYQTRLFVEGGYHSCVLPGSNGSHWCK